MKGFTLFIVVMVAVGNSGANNLEWSEYAGEYEGNFVVKIAKDDQFLCMGCIIYANWVLTTANCLAKENITITAGSNWFSNSSRLNETSIQSRSVTSKKFYVLHPNYVPQESSSENIALVYIEEPFNLLKSRRVSRIYLPFNNIVPISGKVFSWGERFYIFPKGARLHITNVSQVNDNHYCYSRVLQSQKPYLMCSSGHSSPCYLEEGGPLVAPTLKGRTLVGIVNAQMGQREDVDPWFDENVATHYTSVSYFVNWIFKAITLFVPPDY